MADAQSHRRQAARRSFSWAPERRPLPDHQGPSLTIVVNGKPYLVDAGARVVRQANAAYLAGTPALAIALQCQR